MHRLLLASLMLTPSVLSAQSVVTVSGFAEQSGAYTAGPARGAGGEVMVRRGAVGARLGVRVPIGGAREAGVPSRRAWGGDLDVAFAPLRLHPGLAGLAPGGALPYVLAGIGAHATEDLRDPLRPVVTRSYGAGVEVPLIGERVSLYAEGRHRLPLSGSDPVLDGGWETRVGVSFAVRRAGRPPVATLPGAPGEAASRETPALLGRPASLAGRPGLDGAESIELPSSPEAPVSPAPASAAGSAILSSAAEQLGVRYRWGGRTPRTGFDCSGFTQYVFRQHGIELPRVTRDQAKVGTKLPLDPSEFREGDLLFFAGNGRVIDHVAIYVGEGRIVHAPARGGEVRYDNLETEWYAKRLVAARRVLE